MGRFSLLLASVSLLSFTACPNIFDPLDSPDGDAQILSAARACFDRGDLTCALDHYAKLPDNEFAIAESAFAVMDDVGLGIEEFARAIGEGQNQTGLLLTRLIEEAAPYATEANRVRIATAYRNVARLNTAELRGLTRFMLAMGAAALNLAAHSGITGDQIFHKNDIAANGLACGEESVGTCAASGDCGASTAGSNLLASDASDDADFATDPANATMAGPATWTKFFTAINAANSGLTEMGVNTGSSFALIDQILDLGFTPAGSLPCFRYALFTTPGVGR